MSAVKRTIAVVCIVVCSAILTLSLADRQRSHQHFAPRKISGYKSFAAQWSSNPTEDTAAEFMEQHVFANLTREQFESIVGPAASAIDPRRRKNGAVEQTCWYLMAQSSMLVVTFLDGKTNDVRIVRPGWRKNSPGHKNVKAYSG